MLFETLNLSKIALDIPYISRNIYRTHSRLIQLCQQAHIVRGERHTPLRFSTISAFSLCYLPSDMSPSHPPPHSSRCNAKKQGYILYGIKNLLLLIDPIGYAMLMR